MLRVEDLGFRDSGFAMIGFEVRIDVLCFRVHRPLSYRCLRGSY